MRTVEGTVEENINISTRLLNKVGHFCHNANTLIESSNHFSSPYEAFALL